MCDEQRTTILQRTTGTHSERYNEIEEEKRNHQPVTQRTVPESARRNIRQRNKRWCFTLNNWTVDELTDIILVGEDESQCTYLIVAKEIGENGTPHLQGYVEWTSRLGIKGVKDRLGERCHVEVAHGTAQQASDYCKKDKDYAEYGNLEARTERQGYRTDLDDIRDRLRSGTTVVEIAEENFAIWCQYRRAFNEYVSQIQVPRTWKSIVTVYWGPTGVGKTRRVHDQEDPKDLWVSVDNKAQWFDGYNGQAAVLFDDFDCQVNYRLLLQLLDRYPMQVAIKGGFVNWCPRRIYITSNIDPESWYSSAFGNHGHIPPELRRRLDLIVLMQ